MDIKIFGLILCCAMSSFAQIQISGYVDTRDNSKYSVVKIGEQEWMTSNLHYQTRSSKCFYDNPDACVASTLYSFEDAQTVCPDGFHLPSMEEWLILLTHVSINNGGEGVGTSLKVGTNAWNASDAPLGTDKFYFHGMPTGYYNDEMGKFGDLGGGAYYWSSDVSPDGIKKWVYLFNDSEIAGIGALDGGNYRSVRCLKNGSKKMSIQKISLPTFIDSRDGTKYRYVTIGSTIWMADNLNYKVEGSYCYNNDPAFCEKYGRLYPWTIAMKLPSKYNAEDHKEEQNHKGICPDGWRLPSVKDWGDAARTMNGDDFVLEGLEDPFGVKNSNGGKCPVRSDVSVYCNSAGSLFKSAFNWNFSRSQTDPYKFSALPAGYRKSNGDFVDIYEGSLFWIDLDLEEIAFAAQIYNDANFLFLAPVVKNAALSVRCILVL